MIIRKFNRDISSTIKRALNSRKEARIVVTLAKYLHDRESQSSMFADELQRVALPCLALPCLALPYLTLPCFTAFLPSSRSITKSFPTFDFLLFRSCALRLVADPINSFCSASALPFLRFCTQPVYANGRLIDRSLITFSRRRVIVLDFGAYRIQEENTLK